MENNISTIAFDADDTLWVNEPFFREAEEQFARLLSAYMPEHSIQRELFKTEIDNLPDYGYGIKAFMLSMIETAIRITDHHIPNEAIDEMIKIGRSMLHYPIELLDGIEALLQDLQGHYRLVVATKGDLLDQERKLEKSGLAPYFHHVEVMSEKKVPDYQKLMRRLDQDPDSFLMIGNSLKSDVLPVLEIGGYGVHVPFHTTWEHEKVEAKVEHPRFHQLEKIEDLRGLLNNPEHFSNK